MHNVRLICACQQKLNVARPRFQRHRLLLRPVMALINSSHAAFGAADVVQDGFGYLEPHTQAL
jgi:hypothetical protein